MSGILIPSSPRASIALLLVCAISIPLSVPPLVTVNAQATSITFTRTAADYNNQTGSFTLGRQLTDDNGYGKGKGGTCLSYDYFIFNAQAGQALQGELQTGPTGQFVYYMVLSSPNQLRFFENSNCGVGYWGQPQGFNSPSALDWTASANGQYALVFVVRGFYSGPVYFIPQ